MVRMLWMLGVFFGGLLLAGSTPAAAAEPVKVDLFQAGQDGYAIFRIPGIVVTGKGTILVYCEARKTRSDWAAIDPLYRRSSDNGKTWEPARKLPVPAIPFEKNPVALARKAGKAGEITVNNIVMIADTPRNLVHCLYCVEYMRCFYTRSEDDGRTFSTPVEITRAFEPFRSRDQYDWKVLATGPGHGIRLRSGRLIVPVWLSRGTQGNGHKPSCVATIYSDDGGMTWTAGAIIANETEPLLNPSETVAVELSDGRVMVNIRNESKDRLRAVAISPNGISDWSRPRFDPVLLEPICMASICRLPAKADGNGSELVFANPANRKGRSNLTIRLSRDEGQTWPVSRTLEPGASAYSDLAAGPDGTIYCVYERGVPEQPGNDPYQRLTLASFHRDWLEQSRPSGAP